MEDHRMPSIVSIVLLSIGLYQIIAATLGSFFWLLTGDWRPFIPQILLISFWINWLFTYLISRHLKSHKHVS